jgi:hypothetical protein
VSFESDGFAGKFPADPELPAYLARDVAWCAGKLIEWAHFGPSQFGTSKPAIDPLTRACSLLNDIERAAPLIWQLKPHLSVIYPRGFKCDSFAGVRAQNYHDTAIEIGVAVLEEVAEAIDSELIYGGFIESEDGRTVCKLKIPGLNFVNLDNTDLSERLREFEPLDTEFFFIHILRERDRWIYSSGVAAGTGHRELDGIESDEGVISSANETELNDDKGAEPNIVEPTNEEILALSPRQYYILKSLLLLGATSANTRCTTEKIAKRAEGNAANPVQFKEPVADLKRRNLIRTKEGSGGGCWLTQPGQQLAEKL